jgi:hypothetical protein
VVPQGFNPHIIADWLYRSARPHHLETRWQLRACLENRSGGEGLEWDFPSDAIEQAARVHVWPKVPVRIGGFVPGELAAPAGGLPAWASRPPSSTSSGA